MGVGWQAAISGAIAGSVGLTELLSRYRSSPGFSIQRPAAWLYVLVNAAAGVLALYLVRGFGWTFGQTHNVTLWRILVAGFGALALFRSSLFTTKIGSTDVNIGPSVVLGALLDACDRTVDRDSAENLIKTFDDKTCAGLNPAAVATALPVISLALMQNFDPSYQALLAADLNKIAEDHTLTPQTEMRAVIIQLAKYLGPGVVENVLTKAKILFTEQAQPLVTMAAATEPTTADALAVVSQVRARDQQEHAEEAAGTQQQEDQPIPPPLADQDGEQHSPDPPPDQA